MTEKQEIAHFMNALGITEVEALELIKADKEVDRMSAKELSADMTAEQKKVAKQYTQTSTKKPTVYKFDTAKKPRKVDNEKVDFITQLAQFVNENGENVQIVKAEREISFTIGENSYSLTLTKHRK